MILADTSKWINHLRQSDAMMTRLLDQSQIICHPFVIGELALGSLERREAFLKLLNRLPQATVARHEDVMHFLDQRKLYGKGIGYVDAHLLVATILTPGTLLWTTDKRLQEAATAQQIAFVL